MESKNYFLFGGTHVSALSVNDVVSVLLSGDAELFILDTTNPDALIKLLEKYTGWTGWKKLTQDEYEELEQDYQHEVIGDWAACDLFNWLQDMDIISDDEEIEDWYDSRGDMVDMVRDNIEKFYE